MQAGRSASLPQSEAQLNPFALPSSTTFRFILLIIAIVTASLYIYNYMYFTLPGKQQLSTIAIRDYNVVVQTHNGLDYFTAFVSRYKLNYLH